MDRDKLIDPDDFEGRARALLEEKMMQHGDEGVRAMTAAFGVPEDAVQRVATALRIRAASEKEDPSHG